MDIEPFLARLLQWALQRPDIGAIALVGSHARGQARPDSDIDLLILVENPKALLQDTGWVCAMGLPLRQEVEDWGNVTSLRIWYAAGQEVEYGLTGLDWGSDPADEGAQRVIAGGMRILHRGAIPCRSARAARTGQPVLLIIDMLNDFFRDGVLAERRRDLVRSINDLVALFRKHRLPIIWVRQEFAPDLSDAFLAMRDTSTPVTIAGTDGCQILPELDLRPGDEIVVKKRYSAFFGTGLEALLASMEPSSLVMAGVNTHACVRMTAIDAYQRDHRVVIASDCVSSYDDEHHRVTMRYLAGRMQIMSNAELVQALATAGGAPPDYSPDL